MISSEPLNFFLKEEISPILSFNKVKIKSEKPFNPFINAKLEFNEKNFYTTNLKTDKGDYILEIKLNEDKINISCNSEIEFLSIYSYSKELSYQELIKMSNNFKSCNNIKQIFDFLRNIIYGILIKINFMKNKI